ncbi:MAG: glycosyltransferase family 4 protein [Anaerolineales bacterium]|nr:glycosyltransferase family 4 protein [Anaerolineales bacterium]
MKIVIGVHHFPPRYTGGAEWQAFRTARELRVRGHEVRVVCVEHVDRGPASGVDWQDDVYEGVPVRRLSFDWRLAPEPRVFEYRNPWVGEHLRGWLAEERPDVFHLFSGYLLTGMALYAADELAIPSVVTLTDFWFLCPRISMLQSNGQVSRPPIDPARCAQCLGEERRSFRWLGRLLPGPMATYWHLRHDLVNHIEARLAYLHSALNLAAKIISVSRFVRNLHVEAGFSSEKIIYLRQGFDVQHLKPEVITKASSRQLRVGYIGQIAELKGVHVLIEAARQIDDPRLSVRLYGNAQRFPAYTARLRRLIGNDSRIQFAGEYRSAAELTQVMRDLDVIVVPSLWYENSPNVILEAFAHRTPVIASDFGGMAELVQHEHNGLRFALGDAASLAGQLKRLLTEPDLLPRLRAGIGPVKTVAEETDGLEAIYQEVLAERTGDRLRRTAVV